MPARLKRDGQITGIVAVTLGVTIPEHLLEFDMRWASNCDHHAFWPSPQHTALTPRFLPLVSTQASHSKPPPHA
jgi:hypothetical protein